MIIQARFSADEADAASNAWNFNCGPGALCAVLNKTPDELRPHLLDFEQKGYTNPTLMANILSGLGVPFVRRWELRSAEQPPSWSWPSFGLARIQWAGPWTRPGVPMGARYRASHWIAVSEGGSQPVVFDINAIHVGGWISYADWAEKLVPWLLKECHPNASGVWWPTHCWDITSPLTRSPPGVPA